MNICDGCVVLFLLISAMSLSDFVSMLLYKRKHQQGQDEKGSK